jgi:hypothetical protein
MIESEYQRLEQAPIDGVMQQLSAERTEVMLRRGLRDDFLRDLVDYASPGTSAKILGELLRPKGAGYSHTHLKLFNPFPFEHQGYEATADQYLLFSRAEQHALEPWVLLVMLPDYEERDDTERFMILFNPDGSFSTSLFFAAETASRRSVQAGAAEQEGRPAAQFSDGMLLERYLHKPSTSEDSGSVLPPPSRVIYDSKGHEHEENVAYLMELAACFKQRPPFARMNEPAANQNFRGTNLEFRNIRF